jgi:3-oxoadipate enol-lactonase
VVFANSLGTDLQALGRWWWRGCPTGLHPRALRQARPWPVERAARARIPWARWCATRSVLIEALGLRDVVFVGLSIGGMIAQGLAAKRLDLIRAVVLSNTAPKIGTRAMWEDRIAIGRDAGPFSAMSDAIMERWFTKSFRESPAVAPWKRMVETTPAAGLCRLQRRPSRARISTPRQRRCACPRRSSRVTRTAPPRPDLVQEMAELIPGARYDLIRGAGHLPCVEKPDDVRRDPDPVPGRDRPPARGRGT